MKKGGKAPPFGGKAPKADKMMEGKKPSGIPVAKTKKK